MTNHTPIEQQAPRLFDPAPFSRPGRRYRDERARVASPAPVLHRVELGRTWRLFSVRNRPEVHAVGATAGEALCERAGLIPLSFEPGTLAAACESCWEATPALTRRAGDGVCRVHRGVPAAMRRTLEAASRDAGCTCQLAIRCRGYRHFVAVHELDCGVHGGSRRVWIEP